MQKSKIKPEYEFKLDESKPDAVGMLRDGVTVWYSRTFLQQTVNNVRRDAEFFEEAMVFYKSTQQGEGNDD